LKKKIQKGLKIDVIVSDRVSKTIHSVSQGIEVRVIPQIPATLVCTEKEAAVTFRLTDGKMDYSGFIGNDPTFVSWVKELFLFYWEKAQKLRL
jgi:predicted transcriptional regulator